MRSLVTPYSFGEALEAAGLIHDRDRITEVVIRAKPSEVVTIEVTYVADDRIYTLAKPQGAEGARMSESGPEGDHGD